MSHERRKARTLASQNLIRIPSQVDIGCPRNSERLKVFRFAEFKSIYQLIHQSIIWLTFLQLTSIPAFVFVIFCYLQFAIAALLSVFCRWRVVVRIAVCNSFSRSMYNYLQKQPVSTSFIAKIILLWVFPVYYFHWTIFFSFLPNIFCVLLLLLLLLLLLSQFKQTRMEFVLFSWKIQGRKLP